MSQVLDIALAEFTPSDITPRLCQAMMGVLGVPLPVFATLDDAAGALAYPATVLEKARTLADQPEIRNSILIAQAIDQGDKGLTLSSGLSTVSSFFFGGKAGLQVDGQQRNDAALKALAIALLVFRLIDPPPAKQAEVILRMNTGMALLRYFAAVEFALPFADTLGTGDAGDALEKLIAENLGSAAPKLLSLGGNDGIAGARAVLIGLTPTLKEFARDGVRNVGPIADTVKQYVPAMFGAAKDSLNDLVATGADSLPVYRFLVARFIAEAVLIKARTAVEPGWSILPPAPPPAAPPTAAT